MAQPPSTTTTAPRRAYGWFAGFAVVGLALVALGWSIPSQFKSLPVSILAGAGFGSVGLPQAVRQELDAGRPGAAALLAEAARRVRLPNAQILSERVAEYTRENPDLALWGEANPFLDRAIGPTAAIPSDADGGVVRRFLPPAARKALLDYLALSRNATTRAILATREIKSYQQFLPVISAGGAPLDATILLAGLLVQNGDIDGAAAAELRERAEEALKTGDTRRLETIYLDLLALGRRYGWGQISALVRGVSSLETLARIRHLVQIAPEAAPVIAAGVLVSRRPDAVADYLISFGPHGQEALAFALFHGAGSVALLLRQQLPVAGDLALPPVVATSATDALVRFALESPLLAVVAKIALYLLGGLLLFLAAERVTALRQLELSPVFTSAARGIGAGVIGLFLVLINEPYLALGSQPSGYELKLVIPVLGNATDTATMPDKSFPIDVPTLLSILFFFGLQALVFSICRLKLKEIESKNVPPGLKLRLVENEENLFDAGLYVGIAGTCAALVLQVLHLIQSNLLAAYSSNLFGILCVAIIKIRYVRPYKQRLIIEAGDGGRPAPDAGRQPGPAPQPARVA